MNGKNLMRFLELGSQDKLQWGHSTQIWFSLFIANYRIFVIMINVHVRLFIHDIIWCVFHSCHHFKDSSTWMFLRKRRLAIFYGAPLFAIR